MMWDFHLYAVIAIDSLSLPVSQEGIYARVYKHSQNPVNKKVLGPSGGNVVWHCIKLPSKYLFLCPPTHAILSFKQGNFFLP